jgi:hypothetical protein
MREKKSQAETGVENVFHIFLFLRFLSVCFCLWSAFLSLSFYRDVTGFINLLIMELDDISTNTTHIQFAITISAAPTLQCGQHFQSKF